MTKHTITAALALAALGLIAACGGSSTTLSGHLAVTYDDSGNTSGLCPGPMPQDITAGQTQVIVKAPRRDRHRHGKSRQTVTEARWPSWLLRLCHDHAVQGHRAARRAQVWRGGRQPRHRLVQAVTDQSC
jgi:hypothetical protein